MPTARVANTDLYYEVEGSGTPVLLLSGLSGTGRSWGRQRGLFASQYTTVVPDHPGTGSSARPSEYSIEHHALAMAELLRSLECGRAHLVGSSTGGAIAQVMALDHPDVVRTITLASSWGRADDFFRHQFSVRKAVLEELGTRAYAETSALFLYAPEYFRDHYEQVAAWCDAAADGASAETMSPRIDMILAHDQLDRLDAIDKPALVLVGAADACTPRYLSEQLAARIPGAELAVLDGGHLVYHESPTAFHERVAAFLERH